MSEKRIKEIEKRILLIGIIDLPGVVLFGLGLYGKFGADAESFLPILGDEWVVNAMLVVGTAVMAWSGFLVMKLSLEKSRHMRWRL